MYYIDEFRSIRTQSRRWIDKHIEWKCWIQTFWIMKWMTTNGARKQWQFMTFLLFDSIDPIFVGEKIVFILSTVQVNWK